jgi:two-component system sensor histidine kinase SenX3
MAYFAAQAGIGIVSQLPDDDCVVKGDRLQLVSAVSNLIDNAVKYSEKGDNVTVRVSPADETVDISVSDEGIGIPPSDIDRIFERFYRVDRARSRGTGGTGLGLSIVRHVMNNHGGSVNVTSQEGEGSTFMLTLLRPSGNTAVNNI